jgi:hypothetical protein
MAANCYRLLQPGKVPAWVDEQSQSQHNLLFLTPHENAHWKLHEKTIADIAGHYLVDLRVQRQIKRA